MGVEIDSTLVEIIRRTIREHYRFGMTGKFRVGEHSFYFEASPFAEKRIGTAKKRLALAIYPIDEPLVSQVRTIGNPSFEHSPGAFASARFSFPGNNLVLEELQTDLESLIRINGLTVADDFLAVLHQWREIAFRAAHIFAFFNGFEEFFAASPYRVLSRYGGPMHPDKVATYFDFWEKKGGELVFDDYCELGTGNDRGYYYRFQVDRTITAENPTGFGRTSDKNLIEKINKNKWLHV